MARILVIDDEPMAREMLSECLRYDYEVATAEDGAAGVELANSFRPDLVICDVSMPRMDGFSVLAQFQKIDLMADVPFIFLSGAGDPITVRQGMVLGADDFLTKPFSVRELLSVVKSRLDRRVRRQEIVNKAIDELRLNVTAALPLDRQKYEQQGTGLGLIIAKRLSELSGGRLDIASADSKTTVAVTLPHRLPERIEDFFYA